jgi:hypothetical protein
MKSNFVEDVIEAHPLLSYVISVHLHIERWLRELLSASPSNRNALKKSRLYFLDLVDLCQKQNVFDEDLALVLIKLNTLRNKFAHTRSFNPKNKWIDEFLASFRDMKNPFYIPLVNPNEKELALALASLSGYMEKLVNDNKGAPNNSFNRSAG